MTARIASHEVDWMGGKVPSTWDVFKLKHILAEERKEIGGTAPAGAISFGEVVFKSFNNDETLATYRSVRLGQFLINPLNLNYDLKSLRIALSEIECRVSPAYIVVTNVEKYSNARYLRWALRVFDVQHIKTLGAGVRQTVTFDEIGECLVALPNLGDQAFIATYLDRATERIDALIARKTRFIELLREKRQALITHAVTKGLETGAPMKDSGVEWLGEVPAHWVVRKLGFITQKIGSGKTPHGGATVYEHQGVTFLRSQNIYDDGLRLDEVVYISRETHKEMRVSEVHAGDVLLNITGGSIGRSSIVPSDFGEANVNQHVCIVRCSDQKMSTWVHWFFCSHAVKAQVALLQTGAGREGLNFEQVGNFRLTIPPANERKTIIAHLDRMTARIDTLLSKTERSIELLREHRMALITSAVTGKIDLREAA